MSGNKYPEPSSPLLKVVQQEGATSIVTQSSIPTLRRDNVKVKALMRKNRQVMRE
jgi:hypothetical protein